MKNKFDVSLILACYNEGPIFSKNVKQVFSILDQTDFSHEVIFVEDHSQDRTKQKVAQILKNNPRRNLSVIFHQQNQGRGKTVTDGIYQAKGRVVGFIDIDLEIPADYIPRFINAILQGTDVAVARRVYDFNLTSLPRWLASKGYVFLRKKLLGDKIEDTEAGYKFFKRDKILPVLTKCQDSGWFWDTEIIMRSIKAGLKIKQIPTVFIRNLKKKSTVRLLPDTWDYLYKLFSFSLSRGQKRKKIRR